MQFFYDPSILYTLYDIIISMNKIIHSEDNKSNNKSIGNSGYAGSMFRRNSIQRRIVVLTLSCIFGMCIIVSLASYFIFQNYLRTTLVTSTESNLKMLTDSVNGKLNEVYRMARFCQGSGDIAEYIKASPDPGSVMSVATYDRLYEEYLNNSANPYIPRVVIATGSNYLQTCQTLYSTTVNLVDAIPTLPYFEQMLAADKYDYSEGIIEDPFQRGRPKKVVPIIRPITYQFNSNQGGYLFMEISADLFTRVPDSYYMEEGSRLFLTMPGHIYLLENGDATELNGQYNVLKDMSSDSLAGASILQVETDRGREICVSFPLTAEGCYLTQTVSNNEMSKQQTTFAFILTAILIAIMGIGVLLVTQMNKYIHKPLGKIREKITKTSAGDFTRDTSIEWDHELGDIGRGINELSEAVLGLMETRVEAEKQKRDLEYKMLQSQINPHFLYNTLNSIKMMAQIQGATGISEMTISLSSLLRSISKGTSLLVPISEELSLLKDYFTIQNYRYGGMIQYKATVNPEELNKCAILKFTLQPLVENAIFHGLEPQGGVGNINVTVSYVRDIDTSVCCDSLEGSDFAEDDLCIEVRDDGVGMSAEKARSLTRDEEMPGDNKSEFFKEIGTSNVHKRLKYEFGDDYGIFIDSVEGEYTCARVIIPARPI